MNRVSLCAIVLLVATSTAPSEEKTGGNIKRPAIAVIDMGKVHSEASLAEGETAEEFQALVRQAIKTFALRYRIDVVLSLALSEDAAANNRDVLLYGGISNFKGYDITNIIIDKVMRSRRPDSGL